MTMARQASPAATMRSTRTAVLASVPLAALLVFGTAGPAQAGTCPAGYHFNDFGNGAGFCALDATGGETGGPMVSDGGSGNTSSYGEPMAPPVVE